MQRIIAAQQRNQFQASVLCRAPQRVSLRMNKNNLPFNLLAAYGSLAFPLAAAFIALQVIVPTHYAQFSQLSLSAIGGLLLLAVKKAKARSAKPQLCSPFTPGCSCLSSRTCQKEPASKASST